MRIKSYFSSTVEAALDLARRELGADAVLLNSRPAPPEARHLGIHEVVFGVEAEPAPPPAAPQRTAGQTAGALVPVRPPAPEKTSERSGDQIDALRRQIESLERAIQNHLFQATPAGHSTAGAATPLEQFLLTRGFSGPLAAELTADVEDELARWTGRTRGDETRTPRPAPDANTVRRARGNGVFGWAPGEATAEFRQRGTVAEVLIEALGRRLAPCIAPAEEEHAPVLAFCGPPGGGKTTLLAKLAAHFSLERQWNVAILSCDTLRIAAAEQLRTYAAIMGLPCDVLETPQALDRALRQQSHRQVVLLDLPGWAPAQFPRETEAWAACLAAHEQLEPHLVLPAYLTAREARAARERFAPFRPARLAVTRADELGAGGGLIGLVLECRLPLSYLGTGQAIPEDCEPASLDRLLDLAFAEEDFLTAGPPPRSAAAKAGAREMASA